MQKNPHTMQLRWRGAVSAVKAVVSVVLLACSLSHVHAQELEADAKRIYIPDELKRSDLLSDSSRWSFSRMRCTENFALFWEKGFGMDVAKAPQLDGRPMTVDLVRLESRLESYYAFFRDSLQFIRTGSKACRYRMLVMLNYSLEGTAYGGDYDQEIGALWVAPNRIQDSRLNCIAHELGHSFQSQITCDGEGEAWGGCGFFEMTSQWMLWQVNPEWISDEPYHFEAFTKSCHKAFLHLENIYRSPYVIECWGERHGKPFIAELFRQGRRGEDPVMTYKRLTGLSQEEFCDEMFSHVRRMVNMDFPRAWRETRPYAGRFATPLTPVGKGWQRVDTAHCPENYGFNVVKLDVPEPGATVRVRFQGLAGAAGYATVNKEAAGWRYGLVGIDAAGGSVYGRVCSAARGTATLKAPQGERLRSLYLVVMGAPKVHWRNVDAWGAGGQHEPEPDAQWPYQIRLD